MERLYEFMRRQLDNTSCDFFRYVYSGIAWESRMLGLVGPRGVGKTTLFLQRIKQAHTQGEALYISADHLYFSTHTLFEVAEAFVKSGGTRLFVDEVHKYANWSTELKMMYDSFPDLHVYFTGSSVLDIEKGEADLSRRAPKYVMQGLSFREYLRIRHGIRMSALTLEEILDHRAAIPEVKHPLPLFDDYLRRGYYPFGADIAFPVELDQVITRTLEVDIPQFSGMSFATGRKLKRLMAIIGSLAPFKPNMTQLAGKVQVSRNNVEEYLGYMEKAGMVALLKAGDGLGSLGKTEKVYLDNPNIAYSLADDEVDAGALRETFFFNQMRVKHRVTASPLADFTIGNRTFEVGGKNKGKRQMQNAVEGYVVKADIEYGYGNVVPLWAFGLTY